ncbi:MAG: substrate-binding periplasmic protein [Hyphomicrobium sp.]
MIARRRAAVAATAIVVGLAYAAYDAAARPLDDVVASGKLRIALYEDNRPFSWTDDGGKPTGIDVEIGAALAKEIGVEPEYLLRIQGEEVDDDIRANIWRGPLTGGGVGDVMLHVPTDRELAMRNKEAVISNPYFLETIAVAIHPDKIPHESDFSIFKKEKVGVLLGSASDYFLMTFEDGALVNNVAHHVKGRIGAKEFLARETSALMGVRSEIEGLLKDESGSATFITPAMDGIVRTSWAVGAAVDEKSRDLGYAIGEALTKLRMSGALTKIFAKYGVTYIPPPGA